MIVSAAAINLQTPGVFFPKTPPTTAWPGLSHERTGRNAEWRKNTPRSYGTLNFGEEELEAGFLEWHAEVEAALDRGVPGLPQDFDRELREVGEALKKLRARRKQIARLAARFEEWGPQFHANVLRALKKLPEPERSKQIADWEAALKALKTYGSGFRADFLRAWIRDVERERAQAKEIKSGE